MSNEKFTITRGLLNDIIEQRKKKGLSAYELSEKSGHSKYWLSNIESGKTQKISRDNLISLYKILLDSDEIENILCYIGEILKFPVDSRPREWYECIEISKEFDQIYDNAALNSIYDSIWNDCINSEMWNFFGGLSVHQKQAALTAINNFYNSLFKEPEFAFLLLNIPIFGIKSISFEDRNELIRDLLSLFSKYNDLVIKNKSLDDIKAQHEFEEYYKKRDKKVIQEALDNFKKMIQKILDASKTETKNLDMYILTQEFRKNVSLVIEDGQPNAIKSYLQSTYKLGSGENFSTHIQECVHWFIGFQNRYELPYLYDIVDKKTLDQIYNYLNSFGEIRYHIIK